MGKAFTWEGAKRPGNAFCRPEGIEPVQGTVEDHECRVDASSPQSVGAIDVLFGVEGAVGSEVTKGSPSGSAPPY